MDRIRGTGRAVESPVGWTPSPEGLDLRGLEVSRSAVETALGYERDAWLTGLEEQRAFFEQ